MYRLTGMGDAVTGPGGTPLEVPVGGDANVCINGFNVYGEACTDFTPITSDPTLTAQALKTLYGGQASQPQTTKINPLYIAGGLAAVFVLVSMMGGRRR